VKTLSRFRKSLVAHTLLPSTSHAVCRLFVDSNRLSSLVRLLEKRVEFGIFSDPFMLNIIFDRTLEDENIALASRVAALIMLQEEFGLNDLNDNFALYSVSRYIESKTDFQDWVESTSAPDPILEEESYEQLKASDAKNEETDSKNVVEEDGDEEEEDAEYIRVPFLRNSYSDEHFDLTNPREICGKTLSMLGQHLCSQQTHMDSNLGAKISLLGSILQADWSKAMENSNKCVQARVTSDQSFKEAIEYYLGNFHEVEEPDVKVRESILLNVSKLSQGKSSVSHEVELRHGKLQSLEQNDISQLRQELQRWSKLRHEAKESKDAFEAKQKLIAEIKAKKEELKLREQYLYFYDDLKRRNLTRIEYD
jgi:small subunit ribosomal protein S27